MAVTLERYSYERAPQWDAFVRNSKNGTFLFERGYMDYHADRFADYSLMAYDCHQRLVGVLPANIAHGTLYSHQGLTYGGWVLGAAHTAAPLIMDIWQATARYCRDFGFHTLVYKPIPYIYCRYPSEEDLYALWRLGAVRTASQLSATIPLPECLNFNENSRRNLHRAQELGLRVEESTCYEEYWQILTAVLAERHAARPVHTVEEMRLLASRFEGKIKLFVVRDPQGTMVAGTVVYLTSQVVHTQYIASSDAGTTSGALALLVSRLLGLYRYNHRYFDFGTSTEQGGRVLNEGLVSQKNGFGGRGIVYDTYQVNFNS